MEEMSWEWAGQFQYKFKTKTNQVNNNFNMEQQSILNFLNQFLVPPHIMNSIVNLSDGVVFLRILSFTQELKIDLKEVKEQPQSWQERLTNLRYLTSKINKYSQIEIFSLESDTEIDLLDIAKNQNQKEIISLFQKVLGVMLNTGNRNQYIQKIMNLNQEEQELFKDKIVRSMKEHLNLSPISSPRGQDNNSLLLKLSELEEEVKLSKEETQSVMGICKAMESELSNYKDQNSKLKETILSLEKDMITFRLHEEASQQEDLSNSNHLIAKLQHKLIEQSEEYQKKYVKLEEELMLFRSNADRGERAENLLGEAQTKIRELSEKVFNLKQQNDFLTNKTLDLEKSMKILEYNNESLNNNIAKVEFQKISLMADNSKVNARSSELQKLLSMSFEQRKPTQRLQTETLEKLDDPFQIKYDEIKEELNIANKRVKELERELAKCNLKLEKLEKVAEDKSKLEEVLVDFTNSRGEEIQLLTFALYELRLRYGELVKKQPVEDSTSNSIQVQ